VEDASSGLRNLGGRATRPLEGDLIGVRLGGVALLAIRSGTIQCPNGLGFQFDNELLDYVLDALALGRRNLDEAIVLARGQLALHEYVSAFPEPVRQLRETLAERDHVMPLCPFLPLVFLVLPGLLSRDGEFRDRGPVRQILGFGVLADEADDRKLIEVHVVFLFRPCCAWAQKREAGCSQTCERAFSGDRKVFRRICERRSP